MLIIQGVNCIFSVKEKTKSKRQQYEHSHDIASKWCRTAKQSI